MRIRRLWAEVAGPADTWEQGEGSARDAAGRFEWLEFQNSAEIWNSQGVRLAKDGQYDAALAAYEKAKTFNPNSAVIQSNLSRACLRKGDLDRAVLELSGACRLAPDNVDYSRRLADLHVKKGDLERAELEFLRATTLAPDEADVWLELCNVFVEAGRLADATRVLAAAQERFPEDGSLADLLCSGLAQLASQQADAGQLEAAEANLAAASELGSSWPWAKVSVWTARGDVLLAREHPFRACCCIPILLWYLASCTITGLLGRTREALRRWRAP